MLSKANSRILVTGGTGFLGQHVVSLLQKQGYEHVFAIGKHNYDLRISRSAIKMYEDIRPHIVIHLAAYTGSYRINRKYPAKLLYDNLLMGIHTMHCAWQYGVRKFIAIGSACAYPASVAAPFKEEYLWNGHPEESCATYGLAKRMLLAQAQAYRQQYGFNAIYLLPVTLYGPGDSPASSRLIPTLIKKCMDAQTGGFQKITLWGTGKVSHEFLYVEDAARAIVLAMEKYNKPDPVNIGSGTEVILSDLASLIAKLTGFNGQIVWDSSKPDSKRRCVDTSRAERELGFRALVTLQEGLKRTIQWFKTIPSRDCKA